jgi:glycosyltransferase involved in cell wall biosynthesis
MVLAAIARGLGPRIDNVVLTRGYDGCPRFESYDDLSVCRYSNPAPERWKDYATGAHHVPFSAKACVAALDVAGCIPQLRRLAKEADLVHVHFPLPLGISVLALRELKHVPVVVTVHGNADFYELPRTLMPLTRAVLERADAIVSVSHDLASHLLERLGVGRVSVVPNGVDTQVFRPARRARSKTVSLLSISRLVPRKNITVLIAAVHALAKEENLPIRLVVAGTGPEAREIAQRAARSAGIVQFLGPVGEERKRELLAEADAFVQLSVREGLSIATLEALASGLPCVVSDLPGVREPVVPGKTGFLVGDPENDGDVARTLRRLIHGREQLEQMGEAARRTAEAQYSLTAMAEGYWDVYRAVLGRRGS